MSDGVYCPDCDTWLTKQETIPATNHANKYDVKGSDPTCTETGLSDGVYCPDCETWLDAQETIPATNHAKKQNVVGSAPTCTETGLTDGVYCPDCDTWLTKQETIPATNHANKYDVKGSDPTCTETGLSDGVYCPDCETWLDAQETIPATNHANKYDVKGSDPTCTETGLTDGVYCPDCNTWLDAQETIPATNHAGAASGDYQAPTCTEPGHSTGTYCPDCDTWLDAQENIPATNHANKYDVEGSDATCTEDGLTDGVYCPDCETWLTKQETIPATNHANKYDVKGSDPTCTETGLSDGVYCPDCDTWLTKQETIPATNHANAHAGEGYDPTCTENGLTDGLYCPDCEGWVTPQETIPAPGHTNGTPVKEHETDSTCTVAGTYDEVIYCTECQEEVSRENKTKDLAEHDWVKTDCTIPTTCSGCGETQNDVKEHEFHKVWEEDGFEYIKCKDCNQPLRKQTINLYDEEADKTYTYLTAYSGRIEKNYCVKVDGKYYNYDEDGHWIVYEDGFVKIDDVMYIYKDNEPVRRQVVKIDGYFYLTDYSGKIEKSYSCYLTDPHEELPAGRNYYFFDADGKLMDGVVVIENVEYLYRDGDLVRRELVEINGKYYLTAYSGKIQKNHSCRLVIDGESVYCEFDENGVLINVVLGSGMGMKY